MLASHPRVLPGPRDSRCGCRRRRSCAHGPRCGPRGHLPGGGEASTASSWPCGCLRASSSRSATEPTPGVAPETSTPPLSSGTTSSQTTWRGRPAARPRPRSWGRRSTEDPARTAGHGVATDNACLRHSSEAFTSRDESPTSRVADDYRARADHTASAGAPRTPREKPPFATGSST